MLMILLTRVSNFLFRSHAGIGSKSHALVLIDLIVFLTSASVVKLKEFNEQLGTEERGEEHLTLGLEVEILLRIF